MVPRGKGCEFMKQFKSMSNNKNNDDHSEYEETTPFKTADFFEDEDMDKKYHRGSSSAFHKHDHEFLGSTRLAELEEDPHNHRFAGVSGPEIKVPGGHVHEVKARTDFYEDHFHVFEATSELQRYVGGGRHVHFVKATTNEVDGHTHDLIFATLIDDPIGEEDE